MSKKSRISGNLTDDLSFSQIARFNKHIDKFRDTLRADFEKFREGDLDSNKKVEIANKILDKVNKFEKSDIYNKYLKKFNSIDEKSIDPSKKDIFKGFKESILTIKDGKSGLEGEIRELVNAPDYVFNTQQGSKNKSNRIENTSESFKEFLDPFIEKFNDYKKVFQDENRPLSERAQAAQSFLRDKNRLYKNPKFDDYFNATTIANQNVKKFESDNKDKLDNLGTDITKKEGKLIDEMKTLTNVLASYDDQIKRLDEFNKINRVAQDIVTENNRALYTDKQPDVATINSNTVDNDVNKGNVLTPNEINNNITADISPREATSLTNSSLSQNDVSTNTDKSHVEDSLQTEASRIPTLNSEEVGGASNEIKGKPLPITDIDSIAQVSASSGLAAINKESNDTSKDRKPSVSYSPLAAASADLSSSPKYENLTPEQQLIAKAIKGELETKNDFQQFDMLSKGKTQGEKLAFVNELVPLLSDNALHKLVDGLMVEVSPDYSKGNMYLRENQDYVTRLLLGEELTRANGVELTATYDNDLNLKIENFKIPEVLLEHYKNVIINKGEKVLSTNNAVNNIMFVMTSNKIGQARAESIKALKSSPISEEEKSIKIKQIALNEKNELSRLAEEQKISERLQSKINGVTNTNNIDNLNKSVIQPVSTPLKSESFVPPINGSKSSTRRENINNTINYFTQPLKSAASRMKLEYSNIKVSASSIISSANAVINKLTNKPQKPDAAELKFKQPEADSTPKKFEPQAPKPAIDSNVTPKATAPKPLPKPPTIAKPLQQPDVLNKAPKPNLTPVNKEVTAKDANDGALYTPGKVEKFKDGASQLARNAKQQTKDTGKAIEKGLNNAGKTVTELAENAKQQAKNIGKAFETGLAEVKDKIENFKPMRPPFLKNILDSGTKNKQESKAQNVKDQKGQSNKGIGGPS